MTAGRLEQVVVLAGTHMAACTSLRDQLSAGVEQLAARGIHLPASQVGAPPRTWHNLAWDLAADERHDGALGTLDAAIEGADRAGASTLILASEEFERPLRSSSGVRRLVELASSAGARVRVALVFRHQVPYLNLVHAFRSITGRHGAWFEDFVRAPGPAGQFDYPGVVECLAADPEVELEVCDLTTMVEGGGLPALLAMVDLPGEGLDLPGPVEEVPPDAGMVDTALMARRLGVHAGRTRPTELVRRVLDETSAARPRRGPYWGWTPALLEETAERFARDNARLQELTGLQLRTPASQAVNRMELDRAAPREVGALVTALRADRGRATGA